MEAHYPGSIEARQANLTLAELHLQRGAPEVALVRFRSYRGRALNAEALWGEARALEQLGRTAEEWQVLTLLTQRFPTSPYSEVAERRLAGREQ